MISIGSIAEWETILLEYEKDLETVLTRMKALRHQHRLAQNKSESYMKLRTYSGIRDDLVLSITRIKQIIEQKKGE